MTPRNQNTTRVDQMRSTDDPYRTPADPAARDLDEPGPDEQGLMDTMRSAETGTMPGTRADTAPEGEWVAGRRGAPTAAGPDGPGALPADGTGDLLAAGNRDPLANGARDRDPLAADSGNPLADGAPDRDPLAAGTTPAAGATPATGTTAAGGTTQATDTDPATGATQTTGTPQTTGTAPVTDATRSGAPATGAHAAPAATPGSSGGGLGGEVAGAAFVTGAEGYRASWVRIQSGFVDDPRGSVTEASDLVSQVTRALLAAVQEREQTLRGSWEGGGESDTENLRNALRDYRSFFERLMKV